MRLRKFLRKVHRWIGIVASIWLLLLATTGFFLQHKDDWGLDQKYTNSKLLLSLYDIGEQYTSYQNNNDSLAQMDYQLYINEQVSNKLEEVIIGAIYQEPYWIIATKSQLIWTDQQGQIVQTMDEIDGLPIPIDRIGFNKGKLLIQHKSQTLLADTFLPTQISVKWSQATDSINLKEQLIKKTSHNYLSYQQLLFDLHAGITSPSLFNDLAAIALIFLSFSGIIIFFKKSFKSQKKQNQNKVK